MYKFAGILLKKSYAGIVCKRSENEIFLATESALLNKTI